MKKVLFSLLVFLNFSLITSVGQGVPTQHTVVLTWSAPTGLPTCTPAVTYNVYRSTTKGGETQPPLVTGLNSTTYTDVQGITDGTTYFYTTTAVCLPGGESAFSSEASAVIPPATPSPTNLVTVVK